VYNYENEQHKSAKPVVSW